MNNSLKISVLIRSFNEAKWIGLCLKKINDQSIKPDEIVIIDTGSTDGTKDIAKLCKSIKIYQYNKNYLPGKVLNFGISKTKNEFVLILSAHCIAYDKFLLENLVKPIKDNNKISASYARQIPLNFSDSSTTRDLMMIYGPESKLQKNDPSFNNACSLIKKKNWKENKFNEKTTNLEDRIWASNQIKKKNFIYYSAKSLVYHHHGFNHNNEESRLLSTSKVITKNRNNFFIPQGNFKFEKKNILPIFFLNKTPKKNIKKYKKMFGKNNVVLFVSTRKDQVYLKTNFKHIFLRKKNEKNVIEFFLSDVIEYYKKTIKKFLNNKEYMLIFSDNFRLITNFDLKKIIECANNEFPDLVYFAKENIEPIFKIDDITTSVNRLDYPPSSRRESKNIYIADRSKGILMHNSNLYKKNKFSGKIKLLIL